MAVRAFLYDATSVDREVTLSPSLIGGLHDKQLLWVDLSDFTPEEVTTIAGFFSLQRESVYQLLQPERRPRLDNYGAYFQLNTDSIEETDGHYDRIDLTFIVAENVVITAHRKQVSFLESFDERVRGDSELGQLDEASFLASLLDWHITSYFRIIELMEVQIDHMDSLAMRPRHTHDLLTDLSRLRQRVAYVRRTLTPHREVYAALARPDFVALSRTDSAGHFRMLNDRLARAIDAVENARELLVGSFEMFTTQTALRTNSVVKLLTLVSVVLLPANVIVAIAGFFVRSPIHDYGGTGFGIMVALILATGAGALLFARYRRWI